MHKVLFKVVKNPLQQALRDVFLPHFRNFFRSSCGELDSPSDSNEWARFRRSDGGGHLYRSGGEPTQQRLQREPPESSSDDGELVEGADLVGLDAGSGDQHRNRIGSMLSGL